MQNVETFSIRAGFPARHRLARGCCKGNEYERTEGFLDPRGARRCAGVSSAACDNDHRLLHRDLSRERTERGTGGSTRNTRRATRTSRPKTIGRTPKTPGWRGENTNVCTSSSIASTTTSTTSCTKISMTSTAISTTTEQSLLQSAVVNRGCKRFRRGLRLEETPRSRLAGLSILCSTRRRVARTVSKCNGVMRRGFLRMGGKTMPIIWWLLVVPFTVILLFMALGVIHVE